MQVVSCRDSTCTKLVFCATIYSGDGVSVSALAADASLSGLHNICYGAGIPLVLVPVWCLPSVFPHWQHLGYYFLHSLERSHGCEELVGHSLWDGNSYFSHPLQHVFYFSKQVFGEPLWTMSKAFGI